MSATPRRGAPQTEAAHDTADTRVLFDARRRRGRWSRWRWVALGLAAVLLIVTSVWLVFFSSVLAVDEVEVEGTSVLTAEEVRAVARVPEGRPLVRVDLDGIERRVEALSAISEAEATRVWPDTVRVTIVERKAIAVVEQGGTFRELDAEGVAFRAIEEPPDDLPLVELGDEAGSEALREAASVVAAMPERTAAKVASIAVETVDEITLRLRDGGSVVWGSAENSSEKAEVLDVLLAQELEASEYDVSVPGRPTTR